MCSQNFTVAGKCKTITSNLGQILRNHQKLSGKRGLDRIESNSIHGSATLGIVISETLPLYSDVRGMYIPII